MKNLDIGTAINLSGNFPLPEVKSEKQLWIIVGIVVLNSIGVSLVMPLLPFVVGKYLPPGQVVVGRSALLSILLPLLF